MAAVFVSNVGPLISRAPCVGASTPRRPGRAATLKRRATTTEATTLGCSYTYLGGNSFWTEMKASGVKVLCDPWLVGDLTFFDLPALYTGRKASLAGDKDWMSEAPDVILLSQGWEDHCHRPTLRRMPKDIPVVGSPTAADVARDLGFTNVTALRANARVTVRPRADTAASGEALSIVAVEGALVGPPWSTREAGFFLADGAEGARLYYEPHCSYVPESVKAGLRAVGGTVDAVITPVRSVDVVGFPLVSGGQSAVDLLECLGRPRLVIPLRNGELEQEGVSVGLIGTDGTTGEGFAALCDERFGVGKVKVEMPTPGVEIVI